MSYRNFDLWIIPDGERSFTVAARSTSGEAREPLLGDPAACLEDPTYDPPDRPRLAPSVREEWDRRRGDGLFRSLFHGSVRALFDRCLGEVDATSQGVRIQLRFDPREHRLARLAALPWELLYDRLSERFLSLDPRTPVVRIYDVHHRPPVASRPTRLRILVAGAQVAGEQIDLDGECRRIREAVAGRSDIVVERLAETSRTRLVDRLQNGGVDVLHLMTHGTRPTLEEPGFLILEDARGRIDRVSGSDLARLIGAAASRPRLVVLNACSSAAGSLANPLTSVAAALVLDGCPMVVAMAEAIFDEAALALAERFYGRLAKGEPLEAAMAKARLAIDAELPEATADWSLPVIFSSPDADSVFLAPPVEETAPATVAAESEPAITSRRSEASPSSIFSVVADHIGQNYNVDASNASHLRIGPSIGATAAAGERDPADDSNERK